MVKRPLLNFWLISMLVRQSISNEVYDSRCFFHIPISNIPDCKFPRWFFDRRDGKCKKSCNFTSSAPFRTKRSCDWTCRSEAVCTGERGILFCSRGRHLVYYFDGIREDCLSDRSCVYRGNNFPSRNECETRCLKRTIG
uniref:Pancreatic trypsin inhibitor n=1 Tax=Rhipicephalus zambeziensis TaxID=60191 RepID=A0A224YBS6_9ACAR